MAAAVGQRFAPRPVPTLLDQIADALEWPRSRPVRLLAGARTTMVSRLVICTDEAALLGIDAPADTAALLATPPISSDGRLGRRGYDPFAGSSGDVATWHRQERVVLDASLLLAGCAGGIDEQVARLIDLRPLHGSRELDPLRPVRLDVHKFVMYVPVDEAERVRDAVFAAGAGHVGSYDRCSWSTLGTGTFRGGPDSDPTIGEPGSFERVEEQRIEVLVPTHRLRSVQRAYRAAHPYEVPAFDVVHLDLEAPVGFGRVGILGSGGGAAWSTLGQLDPELAAYGHVDQVPVGATCAVYAGPLRDVLDAVLIEPDLQLIVVGAASDDELGLLVNHGISVHVLERRRAVDAAAVELAGRLTRALSIPVTVAGALHFPAATDGEQGATAAPATTIDAAPASYESGTWRLHFDGGSRGNPGPAAYGWVLYAPDGSEHEADGVRIGTATNNVAEWTGLLRGLEHARERGIRSIAVRGDSELVVKQVTGVYRVKNAALKPLAEQVADVLRGFDHFDVEHVYRDANARADAVANEAMDGLR